MGSIRPWRPTLAMLLWLTAGAILCLSQSTIAYATSAHAASADTTTLATQPLQVWRIYFSSQSDLEELASRFDVWEVNHDQRFVVAPLTSWQSEELHIAGRRLELDEARTQRLAQLPSFSATTPATVPGFACYRTVEETYADLNQLATANPNLATWTDIGDSWEKVTPGDLPGYDIRALVLTNQNRSGPKFRYLVIGAVHAREMVTTEVATRFAERLLARYGTDPDVTWLLDHAEIHIVPIANPDGRKIAEELILWRKNTNQSVGCFQTNPPYYSLAYGVDLNRNSSFKWNGCAGAGCSSPDPCSLTYRGPAPASEPETQVQEAYIRSLFSDQRTDDLNASAPENTEGAIISLHSYSELILFPWGWTTTPSPNFQQLQTLGRKFGYHTGYGVCQSGAPGCLYPTDGTLDDWAYGELGIPTYTFEFGTEFFQSCSVFEDEILQPGLDALMYGFKAARRPYTTPAGPEVVQARITPPQVVAGSPFTLTAAVDDTRYASGGFGPEPSQPIAAVRYTMDAPSWTSTTAPQLVNATDGQFDSEIESVTHVIDSHGLSAGSHLILIEGQDNAGNWGVPTGTFVEILESTAGFSAAFDNENTRLPRASVYTYTITITNTGIVSDLYTISLNDSRWTLIVSPEQVGPIPPGGTTTAQLLVHVPLKAKPREQQTLQAVVRSTQNPANQQQIELVVEIDDTILYLPLISNN